MICRSVNGVLYLYLTHPTESLQREIRRKAKPLVADTSKVYTAQSGYPCWHFGITCPESGTKCILTV